MKNIHIPEPCSENWNEMTPSQKGAFCQKCALDVYDFTNKSGNEIRDILTLNIGSRVCGRIEPQQLAELNHDFSAWQINNQRSFQRAWIFTLFVVFGMTLFSCEEDEEPVLKSYQKAAQTILTTDTVTDSVKSKPFVVTSKSVKNDDFTKVDEPHTVDNPVIEMLGEIAYQPEEVPDVPDSLNVVTISQPVRQLMGAMVSTQHYAEYLHTQPITECATNQKVEAIVFPNPAVNETTLKINMPEKAKGEIELFALSGQKIKTIHSGRLQKGETTFTVDVTSLKTGNYLIVIYANGQKETVEFSKL